MTKGIRVVGPDGTVYQNGETATVHERVARRWIRNGWASDGRTAGTLPDPRGLASTSTDDEEPEPKADKASESRVKATRTAARRDPRKTKGDNTDE